MVCRVVYIIDKKGSGEGERWWNSVLLDSHFKTAQCYQTVRYTKTRGPFIVIISVFATALPVLLISAF